MKIILIAAVLILTLACTHPKQQSALQSNTQQSVPFWTPNEEKEYQECLPESLKVWKYRREAEDYCLLDEEHKHWMRNHPETAGMTEDKGKHEACVKLNKAKINGTLEEFRAAYDGCMAEAYGIH